MARVVVVLVRRRVRRVNKVTLGCIVEIIFVVCGVNVRTSYWRIGMIKVSK